MRAVVVPRPPAPAAPAPSPSPWRDCGFGRGLVSSLVSQCFSSSVSGVAFEGRSGLAETTMSRSSKSPKSGGGRACSGRSWTSCSLVYRMTDVLAIMLRLCVRVGRKCRVLADNYVGTSGWRKRKRVSCAIANTYGVGCDTRPSSEMTAVCAREHTKDRELPVEKGEQGHRARRGTPKSKETLQTPHPPPPPTFRLVGSRSIISRSAPLSLTAAYHALPDGGHGTHEGLA